MFVDVAQLFPDCCADKFRRDRLARVLIQLDRSKVGELIVDVYAAAVLLR